MRKHLTKTHKILLGLAAFIVLATAVYYIPPVHERLAWRLDELRMRIKYFLNPPEEVNLSTTQNSQVSLMVTQTMRALQMPTQTPTLTATPFPTDMPTPTPTMTPTPLPDSVSLDVPVYVSQCNRWNYCGISNLAMALEYWGWKGLPGDTREPRDQIASVVKPGENDPNKDFIQRGASDKNVMPYELVDFVNNYTEFRALYRYGGDIDLLKRMVANGYPVLIEKGYYQRESATLRVSWMGHYSFVTGYDDSQGNIIWQDTYPNRCLDMNDPKAVEREGRDNLISGADLMTGWRGFNYVFIIVYPANRQAEVLSLLGPWADENWAAQRALDVANNEISTLSDVGLFFAWFNRGTSHVVLERFIEAATDYDQAFFVYDGLANDDTKRPYRVLWYETGPYRAYYESGRYQNVIDLADITLTYLIDKPTLEESLYWRARAEYALGEYDKAIADMRQAIYYHPGFRAALDVLALWGVGP